VRSPILTKNQKPKTKKMTDQNPQSGAVTALSVVSLVFGAIGMFGSFIPCLGAYAIWIAVPATVAGAIAVLLAMKNKTSKTLPVVATTISAIGLAVSSYQIAVLDEVGQAFEDAANEFDAAYEEAANEFIRELENL
jgi:hypothetical protein